MSAQNYVWVNAPVFSCCNLLLTTCCLFWRMRPGECTCNFTFMIPVYLASSALALFMLGECTKVNAPHVVPLSNMCKYPKFISKRWVGGNPFRYVPGKLPTHLPCNFPIFPPPECRRGGKPLLLQLNLLCQEKVCAFN